MLDLLGTFAFALNGALTAVRTARLDVVGVITFGIITALGGGIIRDTLLGALPPATFVDWRYLAVTAAGGSIAFLFSRWLCRFTTPIDVLDAAGLSLFAVTGAGKALELGCRPRNPRLCCRQRHPVYERCASGSSSQGTGGQAESSRPLASPDTAGA